MARLYGRAARRANRVGQPSAGGDGPGEVLCSAAGILRIRAGRVPAASGLGPAWSFVPVKTGVNPPGVSIFRRVSAEGCRGIFGMAGAAASGGFGWFQMFCRLGFRACRRAWFSPPLGCLHRCCPGASGHPSGPAFRAALTEAFLPFLPGVSGPEGSAGDPGRGEKLPAGKNGSVQEKCEGVSSYEL